MLSMAPRITQQRQTPRASEKILPRKNAPRALSPQRRNAYTYIEQQPAAAAAAAAAAGYGTAENEPRQNVRSDHRVASQATGNPQRRRGRRSRSKRRRRRGRLPACLSVCLSVSGYQSVSSGGFSHRPNPLVTHRAILRRSIYRSAGSQEEP
jgi:hypothetical protein